MVGNIAHRFLFSASSHSVVNLVSMVTAVAVMVPVTAMVVILSLHNGLQGYVSSMYGEFDSPLKVSATSGQFFELDSSKFEQIQQVGVLSRVLESEVLVEWAGRQAVAIIRGVDSMYSYVVPIEKRIEQGEWRLHNGDLPQAIVGAGVSYALGMSITIDEPLYVYALIPMPPMLALMPMPLYNVQPIDAKALFVMDEATDSKYIFAPIEFVENLLGYNGRLSSIEIKPDSNISLSDARTKVQQILGKNYQVKTRYQQREMVFRVINSEKWLIYALLVLVVAIASLSLAGCTLMMISEKRHQSATLLAMGLKRSELKGVFTALGMMIVAIGVTAGIVLGAGLTLLQQHFGIIKMAGDTFLMEAYPVKLQYGDMIMIALGVNLIGYIIVTIASKSVKK